MQINEVALVEDMQIIYQVMEIADYGYYDEPRRAFLKKERAEEYIKDLAQAEGKNAVDYEIKEVELDVYDS